MHWPGFSVNSINSALRENLQDSVSFDEPGGGFFTWLRLPQGVDAEKILPEANKHNVGFLPGANFTQEQGLKNFIRLSFPYYEESELKEAAVRLSTVIKRV